MRTGQIFTENYAVYIQISLNELHDVNNDHVVM